MQRTMIRGVLTDSPDFVTTNWDKYFVSFHVTAAFVQWRKTIVRCTAVGKSALEVQDLALMRGDEVAMCGQLYFATADNDGVFFELDDSRIAVTCRAGQE